jgi:glycine/D-amino acid oxidase-like deaminating enzyme
VSALSFWLEEPCEPLPQRRLPGPAEIEIVGAGVTGCSCALALASAGVRVRVRDARVVAGGASGRNGGFALRGGAMPYDEAREQLGADVARAYWLATEQALDRLEALAGDAFRRTGSLRVAADQAERESLRREFEALRGDGLAVEWLDELESPLHNGFHGALLHPRDGALQPARWVRRLAAAAVEAGAEIAERAPVGSLADLRPATVVIASDGYPAGVAPELDAAVQPTRAQVVATAPIAERLFERPHYSRHGFDYWHQTPEGRIVLGGARDVDLAREATSVEALTEPVQDRLERLLARLVGRVPEITHRWAGIFGSTADRLPLVGPVPGADDLWTARGYSGHGNVVGFMAGALVARALLGENDPLLVLFDPARFLSR